MNATWYVVPVGGTITLEEPGFPNYYEASVKAEELHSSFGNHYRVVKVQIASTTEPQAKDN